MPAVAEETTEQTVLRLLMENDRLRTAIDDAVELNRRLRADLRDARAHATAPTDGAAQAVTHRALSCLDALVRQLERVGGYSTPEDQADLRAARALLAEVR